MLTIRFFNKELFCGLAGDEFKSSTASAITVTDTTGTENNVYISAAI